MFYKPGPSPTEKNLAQVTARHLLKHALSNKNMADPIKDTNEIPEEDDVEEEEDAPEEDGEKSEDDKKSDDEKGEEEDDEEAEVEDDEAEPPTRKSAKDYIIARQKKKLDKVKKETEKKKPESDEEEDSDEDETPEDDKPVTKKDLKPIAEGVRSQADEMEWRDVKTKFPPAVKFEKIIKRYMAHPAYADVPVESIYFIVAGKYGGGTKAAKDQKKNITGGHQRRKPESDGKLPDFDNMSDKELDDLAFKVKTGSKI